ncbi:hypothetical protein BS47DRAFT_434794 [Hydnum rufescens UP504]|uniref:Uncharacterized protein n=1 Tax=Hydnum rufescens UP504 TaxID=1448309 RepID=A0A9P6AIK2_9AGAM|nr:hypothetical protein BS47DRAFT_434794 [Hydnum rufescens UP504]
MTLARSSNPLFQGKVWGSIYFNARLQSHLRSPDVRREVTGGVGSPICGMPSTRPQGRDDFEKLVWSTIREPDRRDLDKELGVTQLNLGAL